MIARDAVLLAKANEIKEEREDIKNAIGVLLGENSVLASGTGDILATSSEVVKKEYTVKATKYRKLNY
jgi:hypothetical protein